MLIWFGYLLDTIDATTAAVNAEEDAANAKLDEEA